MSAAEKYGAHYFAPGTAHEHRQREGDLYAYALYVGPRTLSVEAGDSVVYVSDDKGAAIWRGGPCVVESSFFATVFRGYQCGTKTVSLQQNVNLPYINGCATRQLFPPERIGDPTLQQLTIPPHTSEQKHHIHATVRAVYVLSGRGYSIVGQPGDMEEALLYPGVTCLLEPMVPHHFRTEGEFLTVLPVHVYSSTANEQNHPMFNGTKEV